MKAYLVKYQGKDGRELTKLLLKMTNEMTGEEKWFAGFINDLPVAKPWGSTGTLIATGDICWEKPYQDRLLNMTAKSKLEEIPSPVSSPQTLGERIDEQINQINNKKHKSTKLK